VAKGPDSSRTRQDGLFASFGWWAGSSAIRGFFTFGQGPVDYPHFRFRGGFVKCLGRFGAP